MPTVRYNNYLEINPAFESVVDINADKRNVNLWREYIIGEDMDTLVEYLCESLGMRLPIFAGPSGFMARMVREKATPRSL